MASTARHSSRLGTTWLQVNGRILTPVREYNKSRILRMDDSNGPGCNLHIRVHPPLSRKQWDQEQKLSKPVLEHLGRATRSFVHSSDTNMGTIHGPNGSAQHVIGRQTGCKH